MTREAASPELLSCWEDFQYRPQTDWFTYLGMANSAYQSLLSYDKKFYHIIMGKYLMTLLSKKENKYFMFIIDYNYMYVFL